MTEKRPVESKLPGTYVHVARDSKGRIRYVTYKGHKRRAIYHGASLNLYDRHGSHRYLDWHKKLSTKC
jgi:hypothetical protein